MRQRPAGDNLLHPRLTVSWMADPEREALRRDLPSQVVVVDASALSDRAHEVNARRLARAAESQAGLEAAADRLRSERVLAEETLDALLSRLSELHEAALWCEAAPSAIRRRAEREQELLTEIDEQGRAARTATRQLDRVLEQRAAAEQALVDARRQLDDLGAVGGDETGVRRQQEQASSELRMASTDYRAAMTELARRRSHLEELEAVNAGAVVEVRVDDSQFDMMRAALDAKYRSGAPTSGASAIDSARSAVAEAEADADRAAVRLSEARDRIASFEQELIRRTDGGATPEDRRQAAAALEAQVASVEQRLAEAEVTARDEADAASLALARAERELERLRQDGREHRRQLQAHAAAVRSGSSAPVDDGTDDTATWLAGELRAGAQAMDADVSAARRTLQQAEADLAAVLEELDGLAPGGPGDVAPADRRAAVASFVDHSTVALVLDDLVAVADGALSVDDLVHLDDSVPLVVVTTDADVVSWAIELDAALGAVASGQTIRAALVTTTDLTDRDTPTEPQIRTTMECSP